MAHSFASRVVETHTILASWNENVRANSRITGGFLLGQMIFNICGYDAQAIDAQRAQTRDLNSRDMMQLPVANMI